MRHKYFACYLSNYKNINLKLVIHESNVKLNKNVLYKQNKIVKKHYYFSMDKFIFFTQEKYNFQIKSHIFLRKHVQNHKW